MEETVNKNIEKYQTPHWRGHRSLVGWSQMNYPTVLVNQRTRREPSPKGYGSMDLSYAHQKRPISGINQSKQLYQPFTSVSKNESPVRQEKLGSPPKGYKSSIYTLTTTPHLDRSIITKELTKDERVSRVRPISCEIPQKDFESKFHKKVTQVGEIKYHEVPEDEEKRHLKRLPNTVITEQSLKEILCPELQILNLSNLTWITNDHLNKLGFLAPNIIELNVSRTCADDNTMIEFSMTLEHLKILDISYCPNITEKGVSHFLEYRPEIEKFWAAGNNESITDNSLKFLKEATALQTLNIEFCTKITDVALETFAETNPIAPLKELYIGGCTGVTPKGLNTLLAATGYNLEIGDFSSMTQKEFNNDSMKPVGTCSKLIKLNISGCPFITFEGIMNLYHGDKDPQGVPLKKEEGLKNLIEVRMASIGCDSEGAVLKFLQACPNLQTIDLNRFTALTDTGLNMLTKSLTNLKILLMNYTENVPEPFLEEIKQANPQIKFVRNIIAATNPNDNGLRVALPLKKKAKKKKKGKKGKK